MTRADLDPALVERTGLAAIDHMLDRRGLRQTLESIRAEDEDLWKEIVEATGVAALRSLGIPAAALNAIARGEAKIWPVEPTREMWAAGADVVVDRRRLHHDTVIKRVIAAMDAASPYRSEP